jgi:hypothetical protein
MDGTGMVIGSVMPKAMVTLEPGPHRPVHARGLGTREVMNKLLAFVLP